MEMPHRCGRRWEYTFYLEHRFLDECHIAINDDPKIMENIADKYYLFIREDSIKVWKPLYFLDQLA